MNSKNSQDRLFPILGSLFMRRMNLSWEPVFPLLPWGRWQFIFHQAFGSLHTRHGHGGCLVRSGVQCFAFETGLNLWGLLEGFFDVRALLVLPIRTDAIIWNLPLLFSTSACHPSDLGCWVLNVQQLSLRSLISHLVFLDSSMDIMGWLANEMLALKSLSFGRWKIKVGEFPQSLNYSVETLVKVFLLFWVMFPILSLRGSLVQCTFSALWWDSPPLLCCCEDATITATFIKESIYWHSLIVSEV